MFLFFASYDSCDEALCDIASGRTDSLSVIYREYGKIIFSIALQIIGNKSEAEDILQDTMLKILKSAHNYKKGSNPKAWVLAITKSCAIDRLKQRKNNISLDANEVNEAFCEDNSDFLFINDALSKLSIDDRLILKLKYYADLNSKEIAKIMHLSDAAVRKRLQRSLDKLKDYFDCYDKRSKTNETK